MSRPFVSVITPTFQRHKFLPNLIRQFLVQTYPQERMELVILDDTPEPFDMTPFEKHSNIRYIHTPEKRSIPAKRNELNRIAKGDILVCFDDDDYYPPSRVSHAVTRLQISKCQIAGSTTMYIYDTRSKQTFRMGPYGPNHGTNGTFAYTREYLKDHYYNEDTTCPTGEEKFFTKDYSKPMVQLNPWDAIVCINHTANTFDKNAIFRPDNLVKVNFAKIIKDKQVRDFFMSL